jgi:hypothetical protein
MAVCKILLWWYFRCIYFAQVPFDDAHSVAKAQVGYSLVVLYLMRHLGHFHSLSWVSLTPVGAGHSAASKV